MDWPVVSTKSTTVVPGKELGADELNAHTHHVGPSVESPELLTDLAPSSVALADMQMTMGNDSEHSIIALAYGRPYDGLCGTSTVRAELITRLPPPVPSPAPVRPSQCRPCSQTSSSACRSRSSR